MWGYYPKDDFGLGGFFPCTLDSEVFDLVGGLAEAGGVDEPECHAVDVGRVLYCVAGGAGDVADYGPVVA